MTALREQVLAFHAAMGFPSAESPCIPSDERVRLRLNLMAEEFFETVRAALSKEAMPGHSASAEIYIREAETALAYAIKRSAIQIDMPALIDGLADQDYINEGTRIEFGVNGEPIAAEVQRANLSKAGGPIRADGKQFKKPGWVGPDIAGELRKQGWKG